MPARRSGKPKIKRVKIYRIGDCHIVEPVTNDLRVAQVPRRLPDDEAVVCELPVVAPDGTVLVQRMKVRLSRRELEAAILPGGPSAKDKIWAVGRLRLVNLAAIARKAGITAQKGPAWLETACETLDDAAGRRRRMADLARQVGVHPVHLSRTFRRVFGRTMTKRLQELRLEGACCELLLTNRPVAQVAADHGFADQSHLTRALVRCTGLTPGQLRRKA